jgi:hypothetical protein
VLFPVRRASSACCSLCAGHPLRAVPCAQGILCVLFPVRRASLAPRYTRETPCLHRQEHATLTRHPAATPRLLPRPCCDPKKARHPDGDLRLHSEEQNAITRWRPAATLRRAECDNPMATCVYTLRHWSFSLFLCRTMATCVWSFSLFLCRTMATCDYTPTCVDGHLSSKTPMATCHACLTSARQHLLTSLDSRFGNR